MVGSAENPKPWDPDEKVEDKFDESDHGKGSTYNAGCRCPRCTAANTEKMRAYRKSKRGQRIRLRDAAMRRAWKRLQEAHPDEYAGLVHEEMDALIEETGG